MDEIANALATFSGRWSVGGSALDAAPEGWRALAERDAEPDLALLALAGQALSVGFRPVPEDALSTPAALPRLALPTLPRHLRGRFRRLMASLKPDTEDAGLILTLIAARGFVVHPMDWMAKGEGVPEVYAPWLDWRAGATRGAESGAAETLDAGTWDAFFPAERRAAFAALRRSDPAAACALLAEKASDVAAEERVRLVELLRTGLSTADAEVLRGLAGDRSGRVRALAGALLARLDLDDADTDAVAAELAGFFARAGTVLGFGRGRIVPVKTKTEAQRRRRLELFEQVSLAAFARALGVGRARLVETSDLGDVRVAHGVAGAVERTGTDDEAAALALRLLGTGDDHYKSSYAVAAGGLIGRLPTERRDALAGAVLDAAERDLRLVLLCARHRLGTMSLATLSRSPGVRALLERHPPGSAGTGTARADHALARGLFAPGLLASPAAAAALVDRLVAGGLDAADPALAMLHLNAALTETA
ncbi:MAG: DUF5691 domain-containing protein [Paracoccaceae bacterium]